jgi:hypothetical protein
VTIASVTTDVTTITSVIGTTTTTVYTATEYEIQSIVRLTADMTESLHFNADTMIS